MTADTGWRGHAVLQIGVPPLEPWIVARTRHYDARFVSDDPRFQHAHITILAPLHRWDEAALTELARSTRPFDFTLNELAVFADGCVYLRPEPEAVFRRLTAAAQAAHPDVVPFGAPTPVPHLTLDRLAADVTLASTRVLLAGMLPARCRAEALELVWYQTGNCHLIRRWAFGQAQDTA